MRRSDPTPEVTNVKSYLSTNKSWTRALGESANIHKRRSNPPKHPPPQPCGATGFGLSPSRIAGKKTTYVIS